jgi:hypothetical protein
VKLTLHRDSLRPPDKADENVRQMRLELDARIAMGAELLRASRGLASSCEIRDKLAG